MTIQVVTKDHGNVIVASGDDLCVDRDGSLRIDDIDGKDIAVFAPGAWDYAGFVADEAVPAEPRVWESLADVPIQVNVTDQWDFLWDHDVTGWHYSKEGSCRRQIASLDPSRYSGPFTEVLS